VLVVAAAGAIRYVLKRDAARDALHRFVFKSRIFLLVPSEYEAARFCRNLETLLSGGLALDRSLSAARSASANRWFRIRLAGVLSAVESGATLRTAFGRSEVLPALVVEFAAVGEETGRLAAMMREAAEILERDVETRLDRLTALVLPAATLVMGAIVAGVMAAIVTGLLAVNDLAM
jgi:general secretion pathway protein F